MKFLADENFPKVALESLLSAGVDIAPLQPEAKGSADSTVLSISANEGRVLVTFDKDFGELIFHRSAGAVGVVLFRLAPASRAAVAKRIYEVLNSGHDFANQLTVVEIDRIRVRRFRT